MKYLASALCLIGFGLPAFAGEPLQVNTLKQLSFSSLKDCDCSPCTCDPKSCTCAGCANGCKKSAGETASFVGSDPFETAPTVATDKPAPAPGYHTEYRKVCNGLSCQMVPVTVADAQPIAAPVASPACASCSVAAPVAAGFAGSACSSGSCGVGVQSRGFVRGFFSRGRCR